MTNRILVTGGTGKTGSRVVSRLRALGASPLVGTRSPKADADVRFDWKDPTTFDAAFDGVGAVYLVAPTDDFDSLGAMQGGLTAALSAGVQRFVLLSASSLDEGGPMMGAVHAWLRGNAPEWAVLRPSWFMQNFSEVQHLAPIRDESAIYTATQDGRAGFIDADDIAACAAALLCAETIENTDHILTGPKALSYEDVAAALSHHLARDIHHNRLSVAGMTERFQSLGLPEDYALALAGMDDAVAKGGEDRVTDGVQRITGRPATRIDKFIESNLAVWHQGV